MEEPSIRNWLDIEFSHAKYGSASWGRSVIRAIDMDDCYALQKCMHEVGADINKQVDLLGYDQYLWTCMVHKYIGDTALHLAMRQRKMMCVHVLLYLKARTDIPNNRGETANDLSVKLFGTSAKNLEYEAVKFLLNRTPLKDIPRLPDDPRYRHIEKEAWKLMEQGRVLYTELPRSFGGADPILDKHLFLIRKNYLSFNLPQGNKTAGESPSAAADGSTSAQPGSVPANGEWTTAADAEGNVYYVNQSTGETSWEPPAALVALAQTSGQAKEDDPRSKSKAATESKGSSRQPSPSKKSSAKKGVKGQGQAADSPSSSGASSRAASPGPLPSPSRPVPSGGTSTKTTVAPAAAAGAASKAPASKSSKGAKRGSDDDNNSSASEDSLAQARRAARAKAAAEDGSDSSDDSSDDSSAASSVSSRKGGKTKGTASAKGKKTPSKGKDGKPAKKKKKKLKKIDEAPKKKIPTPPRPRTLREQYEDANAPMSQRAELEVLREDCRLLEAKLAEMSAQASVKPGVSVPPLPQDLAARIVEEEAKLRNLQEELAEKKRIYYRGNKSPSPTRREQRAAERAARAAAAAGGGAPPAAATALAATAPGAENAANKVIASGKTKTGVPFIPAAARAGTGDVWGRDNLCDVIYLIERQKVAYLERLAVSRQPLARGLKLLDSVRVSNPADRVVAHEQKFAAGKHDPMYIPEELEHLQGVKKLKFMNLNRLRMMAKGEASAVLAAQQQRAEEDPKAAKEAKNLASRLARAVSDKILYQQEAIGQESLESASLTGSLSRGSQSLRRHHVAEEPEYATCREITVLSTRSNMKYMKIGDEGAESLGRALQNDGVVTELCLAGARISSVGLSSLAKFLPDIKALRHLDLSNNAVCDLGAAALAGVLPYCVLLEQCNLAGNRISGVGAVKLIQAVFAAPVTWLSLKNNRIVGEDEQAVLKLLEERNYISEQRDRIYEHRPQSTVGVPLAPDEEDEEKQANSSLQDAPRVLKMFVL